MTTDTLPGQSHPLGASIQPEGVNFAVYSKSATAVELLFFDGPDDERPTRVFELDPDTNRTFQYWHILVPGVEPVSYTHLTLPTMQ